MDATSKSAPRSRLIDVLILLAIALIGVVTWKMQPESDVAIPVSSCNLNLQSCAAELPGGGSIEFSVEPRPIPVVRPLALRVAVKGIEPEKIEVDFAGTAMNMGFNRPAVEACRLGSLRGTDHAAGMRQRRHGVAGHGYRHGRRQGDRLAVPLRFRTRLRGGHPGKPLRRPRLPAVRLSNHKERKCRTRC
ncbi:MAG: hypothetical protein MZW92_42850 [Comamonadaceae bacterium]|nr:hypothetical protein [Comamonadaceae bacterium]